jgi:Ca2+-transporting ATPase
MNPAADTAAPTAWHALSATDALTRLEVDAATGLPPEQITTRTQKHGPNRIAEAPPRSLLKIYLSQFKSVLILMLFITAIVAGMVGNIKDALIILTVVMINSVLGFYQEYRAERSLLAWRRCRSMNRG